MSDDTYTPKAGSLAEKVCNYFRLHPNHTLGIDAISERFGFTGNVVIALARSVHHGLLIDGYGDEPSFTAGPNLPGIVNPSAISQSKDKGGLRLGAKRGHLPPLDLSTLKVEQGVEVPAHNVGRGESRWEPLLAKLTNVGDSMQLPEQYKGTVLTYTRKRLKSRPDASERFKIGLDLKGQSRIWRTA